MANLDHLVYKEYLESKDLVEIRDPKDIVVSLDFKVFLALLALEEKRDHQEKMDRMELQEQLDPVGPLELMVLSDKWVMLDQLVQEVPKEKKENVVPLVNLGHLDLLDHLANHLVLTWLPYQL